VQFLPFGGLCQFLIGNVKHLGLDAERKAEKCQFLIGNVKHCAGVEEIIKWLSINCVNSS
jgi:hypothetical protein